MADCDRIIQLFQSMMNKLISDPNFEKKLEEILQEAGPISEQVSSIDELILAFLEKAPYISERQRNAFKADIGEIFRRFNTEDGKTALGDSIKAVEGEIERGRFDFSLDYIPSDCQQKSTEDLIKRVIDDIFGPMINDLSSDKKLRLQVKIEQTIEREIANFLK